MKKSLKRVLVLLSLICAIGLGTTYAFLQSTTNSVVNTFTSNRSIQIELKEPTWDGYQLGDTITGNQGDAVKPGEEANANLGFNQAKNYLPMDVINKNPTLKNNSTKDKAFVAFKVIFTNSEGNKITRTEFENTYGKINLDVDFKEIENEDKSSLFIYNTALDINETATLFTKVTINKNIQLVQGLLPTFSIETKGYAVQGNIDAATAETELINLAK